MLNRRSLVLGLSGACLATSVKALNDTWEALLTDAITTSNPVTLGRIMLPKDSPLWQQAQDQLDAAAKQKVPYRIAKYFVTSLPAQFQTAWPEPDKAHPTVANPLIVLFFLSTGLKPAGDTTPWCSAFLNWCLQHASPSFDGTKDAGSQSFIQNNWGEEVWHRGDIWPPKNAGRGDVAVFTEKSDPAHGHVAFFDGPTPGQPDHIDVLGGNQFNKAGLHTFSVKSLNIHAGLELASIRTAEGLRNV
ncbi:CHAP domain-containing protein [Bradyrhizobium oligotrophicum]|uniref:CHAP domain-containing protein n=1 Tax=Bradyrhizobium TaxID=374 RepID=UPI003EBECF29